MRTTRFSLLLAVCFLAFALLPGIAPPALAAEAVPPAALGDCGAFDWEVLRLTNVERAAPELLRLVSGTEAADYVLPGTARTATVRLYRLDANYAPTAETETLWTR